MTDTSMYQPTARAYADSVRALLRIPIPPTRPLVFAGRSTAALTKQAQALAPLSSDLRRAASASLTAPDPGERDKAAVRLLAHAVTDLQISAYLLQAAQPKARTRAVSPAEMQVAPGDIEESLQLLLDETPAAHRAVRAVVLPSDLPSARGQLTGMVESTANLIEDRAAKTGQAAVSGLLVLGLGPVAKAAGIVGMDLAQALGAAEKVTRLYAMVQQFAISAYNSLVALVGPAIVQSAAQQVLAWINDVAAGKQFEKLLAQLYGTQQTVDRLDAVVAQSQAGLAKFVITIQGVDGISTTFQEQIGLIDKLLRGFRLVSGAAVAAIPQATVLLAVAYIVITAYAVLAGADYIDAEHLKFLNRVPGVRQVVETNLAA